MCNNFMPLFTKLGFKDRILKRNDLRDICKMGFMVYIKKKMYEKKQQVL